MEPIELLSCIACSRIVDQWTMGPSCTLCGTNRYRKVNPSWFTILCWIWNHPKHVAKLVVQDIKEKCHESFR